MDTLILSRLQCAANISVYIRFLTITIALSWVLLYFKLQSNRSGQWRWRAPASTPNDFPGPRRCIWPRFGSCRGW